MPMPINGGRDLAPVRNPSTGKFDFQWDETGNPTFDDSDVYTVMSALLEHREGYWADATGTYGSRLYQIKQDKTSTRTDLIAACEEGMGTLVKAGKIRSVTSITAERDAVGRYSLEVKYQNRDGHVQVARLGVSG